MSNTPFADAESEREFIGGLLRRPEAVEGYLEYLSDTDLFTDRHCEDAWLAVMSLGYDGEAVSVPSVRGAILNTAHSFTSGTDVMAWLMDTSNRAPATLGEIRSAFDRVQVARKKRAISSIAASGRDQLSQPGVNPDEVLSELSQQLTHLEADAQAHTDVMRGQEAVHETISEIFTRQKEGGPAGIPTGSTDLDRVLGTLVPGRIISIGARPGGGKSVVGLDFTRAALAAGAAVIHFSLEMSRADLVVRLLAAEGSIENKRLADGNLSPEDEERLALAATSLPWDHLVIVERSRLTAAQMMAIASAQVRRWRAQGIENALIVVDYLQIMRHVVPGKPNAQRHQEIGETCDVLKAGAKQLHVPVALLSQLGRGASDRPPRLEDLRESGDIENASDQVVLMHRPSTMNAEERPGEIDYIIAKNRHGPNGVTIARAEQFHYARVKDLASG